MSCPNCAECAACGATNERDLDEEQRAYQRVRRQLRDVVRIFEAVDKHNPLPLSPDERAHVERIRREVELLEQPE